MPDARVTLGLRYLLAGKIVVLEGDGHPRILESLIQEWKTATAEKIVLTREGRSMEFFSAGGSYFHQNLVEFWQGDLFEKKQVLGDAARGVALLALSHLAVELPNPHRREAMRLLIKERIDRVQTLVGSPPPCAIFGVDGPSGTLRARYGDDLASALHEMAPFIETP